MPKKSKSMLFWTRDDFDRLAPIGLGITLILYGADKSGVAPEPWTPLLFLVMGLLLMLMGAFIRIKKE